MNCKPWWQYARTSAEGFMPQGVLGARRGMERHGGESRPAAVGGGRAAGVFGFRLGDGEHAAAHVDADDLPSGDLVAHARRQ